MRAINGWYWPSPIKDEELGASYQVIEGRGSERVAYRLMVPKDWACVSPLPVFDHLPVVVGCFLRELDDQRVMSLVLRVPREVGFFGADVANTLASAQGLAATEHVSSPVVDYRLIGVGENKLGYVSVAQRHGDWWCLLAECPQVDEAAVEVLRTMWATFHVVEAR